MGTMAGLPSTALLAAASAPPHALTLWTTGGGCVGSLDLVGGAANRV
jgi:hypothetical protein